jgi:hypothetical protein
LLNALPMKDVGKQDNIESGRQRIFQDIEADDVHTLRHSRVLDGTAGKRGNARMFNEGRSKAGKAVATGESEATKTSAEVKKSLRAP